MLADRTTSFLASALRKTGDPAAKEFEQQIKGYLEGPGE